MDLLREAGLSFCGSFTQTSQNTDIIASDSYIDMLVAKGCFALWLFSYLPIGRNPDPALMPSPEQRDLMRRRTADFRATKPLVMVDFWNDGPIISGCIAGGRKYFHVNANGDIEPCVFCHFAVDNIRRTTLKEALNSPLFRAIREAQGKHDNLLRPCMLIDHPEVGRELFRSEGAYSTHAGADRIFSELSERMDDYSSCYAKIADQVWEKDFCGDGEKSRTGIADHKR